jgi:DNA polymerase III epsilon subunit-like protein
MKILFFDTETTGKPIDYKASYEDVNNWPRVTQIAWLLCDETGETLTAFQSLVKPNGWEIPKEEFFIKNNMSTERCEEEGRSIESILEFLYDYKQQADFLVAHNLSFDHRVLWAEFIRAGMEPRKGMNKICTMMKSTNVCKLPAPNGRGYKWPKLEELYRFLFNKEMEGAHDAMADITATKDCFFELVKRNFITLEIPTV